MSDIAVFTKILQVRKQEQEDAQCAQIEAQKHFEKVATALYDGLKEKESAEAYLQKTMAADLMIEKIKEQARYIQSLTTHILTLQEKVQMAREHMNEKQTLLHEAYIEMKKIEKIIRNKQAVRIDEEKRIEASFMDEISIRQYYVQTQNR